MALSFSSPPLRLAGKLLRDVDNIKNNLAGSK